MMQTVLITGANGFVGYYLTEQLLQKNYRVIATGKGSCRLPFVHPNFTYQPLDFTEEAAVHQVLQQFQPDVIVHSGAVSKPDECEQNREQAFRTNVTGTEILLRQAQALKSFFIYLSTDFIFSGEEGMYKEDDAAAPVNYYGQTKLLAEAAVKQYPYAWSIVRTVSVYGRSLSGRHNIVTMVAHALEAQNPLQMFNDQIRTPTYVEDLATAIASIIEKEKKGIYHISGDDVLTPYQMALAVADYLKKDAALLTPVTEQIFQQAARRPLKTGFDISKAKQELDYTPTPFGEGLKKTFAK